MNGSCMIFPGQGAQKTGMGHSLFESFAEARECFELAESITGLPVKSLCFEGPDEQLSRTDHSQVALLTCSIAAWKVLNRRRPGIPAALFGGLSLGEYSAQVAAGALDFETALKVVDRRATLMQKACEETEGGMVSVIGLDEAAVQSILAGQPGTVTIANLNCPGQIVVSGEKALLPGIAEQAKAAGARMSVVLKVAGAFHSPLMENAARDFHAFLSDIPVHKSALTRVLSNVSGSPYPENADWATAMSRQITRPVYWEKNLRFALDAGIRDFIELGPGKTLCGMLRRIDRSAACRNLETRESLDAIAANEPGALRESP